MSGYLHRWMADRTVVRPGRTGAFRITSVRACAGTHDRCENTDEYGSCDGVVDLAEAGSSGEPGVRFSGLHVYDDLSAVTE